MSFVQKLLVIKPIGMAEEQMKSLQDIMAFDKTRPTQKDKMLRVLGFECAVCGGIARSVSQLSIWIYLWKKVLINSLKNFPLIVK